MMIPRLMFSFSGSVACFFHSGVPRRQCARDDFHAEKLSCCQPKLSDGNAWKISLTKVFRVHNSISSDNIPNTEMCLQTVTVTLLCFTDSCRQCCSSDPTHVNDVWIQIERRPSLQPPFHSVFSEDQLKGQMQVLVRSWSFLLYLNMTFRYYSFAVDSFLGTSLLLSSACFKDAAHHANLCQSFGS